MDHRPGDVIRFAHAADRVHRSLSMPCDRHAWENAQVEQKRNASPSSASVRRSMRGNAGSPGPRCMTSSSGMREARCDRRAELVEVADEARMACHARDPCRGETRHAAPAHPEREKAGPSRDRPFRVFAGPPNWWRWGLLNAALQPRFCAALCRCRVPWYRQKYRQRAPPCPA
jgi:hypothetical protein